MGRGAAPAFFDNQLEYPLNELIGFGLILGHLLGDYVVQNDWMAKNKTNPCSFHPIYAMPGEGIGHLACFVHCLCYTLAAWACSFWWMPWWGLVACAVVHFPVDRFRLASWWMKNISGQTAFATGPLSPWSIIIVDNTFHLLTLFVIAAVALA